MKKKSTLWKILTAIFSLLLIIFVIGTSVANSYKGVIDVFLNIKTYKIENKENVDIAETEYFTSPFVLDGAVWKGTGSKSGEEDYYDHDALEVAKTNMAREVEAEGAVLLFNHDKALPLSKDEKISAFGISTNNLSYGGFGSGGVDVSTAPKLKTALESVGLEVNPTLVDFYENGAGQNYVRTTKGFRQSGKYTINEAPWSVYPEAVKNSFAEYGDAAIMVIVREGGEDNDLPRTNTYFETNRPSDGSGDPFSLSTATPLDSNSTNDGENGN